MDDQAERPQLEPEPEPEPEPQPEPEQKPQPHSEPRSELRPERAWSSAPGLMVVGLVALMLFQFISLTISAAICAYDGLILNPQKEACPELPKQQDTAFSRTQDLILSLLAGRGMMRN